MKTNRRIVCLFAAFILLLSHFSVRAENAGSKEYDKEISILEKLNITDHIAGREYTDKITKIEFLEMVLKGSMVAPEYGDRALFYDVDHRTEGGAYVNSAYKLGIVSGMGAGIFGAAGEVTYGEALSILFNAANFKKLCNEMGGYPAGYRMLASKLGILKNKTFSDYINFGEACEILFNGMCLELQEDYFINGRYDFSKRTDNCMLTNYFGVHLEEGILTRNRFYAIPAGDGTEKDTVVINGVSLEIGSTAISDYVGHDADVYYKEDGDVREVIWFSVNDSDDTIKSDSNDVVRLEPGSFTVEDGGNTDRTYSLSPSAVTIENNSVYKMTGSYSIPNTAEFEFIDNNSDGMYDVVKINKYDFFVVSSVDADNMTLFCTAGSSKKIDLQDYDRYAVKDSAGADIDFSSLKKDDVLAVRYAEDKRNIDIFLCSKTDEELIKSIGRKDGRKCLTAQSGKTYFVSKDFGLICSDSITVGSGFVFALNPLGEIVYVCEKGTDGLSYGYLMKIQSKQEKTFSETIKMKMLTEDSKVVDFYTSDEVKYNGDKVSAVNLHTVLTPKQLIRFKKDENGFIKEILSAADGGDKEFRKIATAGSGYDSRYYTTTNTIGGRFIVDGETKVFIVDDDAEDEKKYSVAKAAKVLVRSEDYPYSAGYTTKPDTVVAEVMVMQYGNSLNIAASSACFVFDEYSESYDTEEQAARKTANGMYNGEYTSLILPDDEKLVYSAGTEEREVGTGDVLRVCINSEGELVSYNVVFNAQSKTVLSTDTPARRGFSAEKRYDFGTLSRKCDKYFRINLYGEEDEYSGVYVPVNETFIYVYDKNARDVNKLKCISFDELGAEDGSPEVFISLYYSQPRDVIIYK